MTYVHHITLEKGEVIMLEAALNMLIVKCDMELDNAKDNNLELQPPFWAHKNAAIAVLKKLDLNTELTSFNNFSK